MSDKSAIRLVGRLAKLGLAGFALAIATMIVVVAASSAFGWGKAVAEFVRSPALSLSILALTVIWALLVRKRLS